LSNISNHPQHQTKIEALTQLFSDDSPTLMSYSLTAIDENGKKVRLSITKDKIKIFD